MSERNLFEELKEGLEAAEQYLQGKITLRAIEAEIPENGAAAILLKKYAPFAKA
ncbi:putative prophage repressor protein [Neisseria meningitidis]|nr:hypothetical protein [Neisseria meningitidis]SUA25513.1 putative prophage repressor protein [Neisseria meningitidis]